MIRAAQPAGLFWVLLAALAEPAVAMPLAPEDCDRARSEQASLEMSGVTADMARGADWGRSNLEPDRLKRIARWIELEERILFRCPRPKLPTDEATAAQNDDVDGSSERPKALQKPKTAAKKKPQSASAETGSGDGALAPAKPAKVKSPPGEKPPTADAFKPAPGAGELQHTLPWSSGAAPAAPGLVP